MEVSLTLCAADFKVLPEFNRQSAGPCTGQNRIFTKQHDFTGRRTAKQAGVYINV
jgi:hypothetical protein